MNRILVVEDDEGLRKLIKRSFVKRNNSHEVKFATNAEEAIEVLESGEFNPHVVLLDWRIPHGGGIRVLNNFQEDKPAIFIVLTSSKNRKNVIEAYKAGAHAYMKKPILFDQYQRVIGNIENFWFDENLEFPSVVEG